MASRLNLQSELEELLGTRNVYFQPPASKKLKYPCIVYNLSDISSRYANDKAYLNTKAYQVTVIDRDPDSDLVSRLMAHFSYISFDRHFNADNLNHDVLRLYY